MVGSIGSVALAWFGRAPGAGPTRADGDSPYTFTGHLSGYGGRPRSREGLEGGPMRSEQAPGDDEPSSVTAGPNGAATSRLPLARVGDEQRPSPVELERERTAIETFAGVVGHELVE